MFLLLRRALLGSVVIIPHLSLDASSSSSICTLSVIKPLRVLFGYEALFFLHLNFRLTMMMLERLLPSFRRVLAFLYARGALGEEIGDIVLVLLTIYRDDE